MAVLFTRAFWSSAAEKALVAGASTLAASGVFTNGALSAHGIEAAGIAFGLGILYSFVTTVAGVKAVATDRATRSGTTSTK